MKCTVTGASGTITWAGQTWNLPADSGLTKTICPDFYQEFRSENFNQFRASHRWRAGGAISNQLDMNRQAYYRWYTFFGSFATWISARNFLNVHGDRDQQRFAGNKRPNVSVTSTNTTFNVLNQIIGEPVALYATTGAPTGTAPPDYFMTAAFFGTHIISGITYSWAKGAGWP
jgi:hypothetical protein